MESCLCPKCLQLTMETFHFNTFLWHLQNCLFNQTYAVSKINRYSQLPSCVWHTENHRRVAAGHLMRSKSVSTVVTFGGVPVLLMCSDVWVTPGLIVITKIIPANDTTRWGWRARGNGYCESLNDAVGELTEDYCDDGCGEVIDYSVQAYFSRYLRVQSCNACGQNPEFRIQETNGALICV